MNFLRMRNRIVSLVAYGMGVLATGCSSFLYYPTREEHVIRSKMPLQPEDVDFVSEDGTRLHGWYFSASKVKSGHAQSRFQPGCAILFFHGNAENLSTHFFTLYSAPLRGYDYFIFDYRGYGRSEGKPSPGGTVQDGRAALRWLQARNPGRPIVVFAQSLGGAVALRSVLDLKAEAAAEGPVRLVVVDSSFASYRAVGRKVLSGSWITWLFQPLAGILLSDEFAPEKDLHNLAPVPLVVIHGDKDQTVDFSLGEKLFAAASEPKEFWRVPGGRHTSFMWEAGGEFAQRFFDRLDRECAK